MSNPLRVLVFGKAGCPKCTLLNQRLDKLLEKDEWSGFEKAYADVETEEGLIAFAEAECLNPQRIPAMLVMRFNEDMQDYEPVPNPSVGTAPAFFKNTRLHQHLGLQTDYTDVGKGTLSPKMITSCLSEAVA